MLGKGVNISLECVNDCQFRTSRYKFRSTWYFLVKPLWLPNGNHKSINYSRQKRKETDRHITKENSQNAKEEMKRRNEQRRTTKTTAEQIIK